MEYIGNYKGYDIYLSTRKDKKYMAKVGNKFIHFGQIGYEHYHDKMGYYKILNHNDKERRRLYYLRHGKEAIKGSPKWFSHNVLW